MSAKDQPDAFTPLIMRTSTARPVFILTLLTCCLLDVTVKLWLQQTLGLGHIWAVWPGVFQLQLVQNSGAAFSLLAGYSAFLQWGSTLAVLTLACFCWWRQVQPAVIFGMIMGGALGNVIDRWLYGAVWDYLDVVGIHYPIFNLADAFICVGVGLLIWATVRNGTKSV